MPATSATRHPTNAAVAVYASPITRVTGPDCSPHDISVINAVTPIQPAMPASAIGPLSRACFQIIAVSGQRRGGGSHSARADLATAKLRERPSTFETLPNRHT